MPVGSNARPSKLSLILLALWLVGGWALAFADSWLPFVWWFMAWPAYLALTVAVVGLRAKWAIEAWNWVGLSLLCGVVTSALGLVFLWGGPISQLGWLARFMAERPAYDAFIAKVRRDSPAAVATPPRVAGHFVRLDQGPPLRVAFSWGGVTDNWQGVVYDPSGIVASARGWEAGEAGRYTAAAEAKKLFGGDLVWCQRLSDAYYRCSFT